MSNYSVQIVSELLRDNGTTVDQMNVQVAMSTPGGNIAAKEALQEAGTVSASLASETGQLSTACQEVLEFCSGQETSAEQLKQSLSVLMSFAEHHTSAGIVRLDPSFLGAVGGRRHLGQSAVPLEYDGPNYVPPGNTSKRKRSSSGKDRFFSCLAVVWPIVCRHHVPQHASLLCHTISASVVEKFPIF